jgi:hypothetical protein
LDFSRIIQGILCNLLGAMMMPLSSIIPLVDELDNSDKLALLKLLAAQIPDADLQLIFSATEYPVYSPYHSTEAAEIMMQMIKDDQQAASHA